MLKTWSQVVKRGCLPLQQSTLRSEFTCESRGEVRCRDHYEQSGPRAQGRTTDDRVKVERTAARAAEKMKTKRERKKQSSTRQLKPDAWAKSPACQKQKAKNKKKQRTKFQAGPSLLLQAWPCCPRTAPPAPPLTLSLCTVPSSTCAPSTPGKERYALARK